MNHSFFCVVGCDVYPPLAFMSCVFPFHDFDRFVRRPEWEWFDVFTYSEAAA